jgi:hypothetical protein
MQKRKLGKSKGRGREGRAQGRGQEGRAQEGGLGSASRILGDAANLIVSGIVTTSVVSLVTAMAPCRPVARPCGA